MDVNPYALPYKRVCGNCKLGDIYRQQFGNYHCNLCVSPISVPTCVLELEVIRT